MKKRLRALDACVGRCMLWAAGSWRTTDKQEENIRGAHRAMIRQMLNLSRGKLEDVTTFCSRANATVTATIQTYAISTWDRQSRAALYDWSHFVQKQIESKPCSPTAVVARWRCLEKIMYYAAWHKGRQGHVGHMRPRRWEQKCFNFYFQCGQLWTTKAGDLITWNKERDTFVDWLDGDRNAQSIAASGNFLKYEVIDDLDS
jgi:hypothetical protein